MNLALNPEDGDDPAYGQIFIVDTEHAMKAMRHANVGIDPQLLRTAYEVIRNVNPFAEAYIMMKEEEEDEVERARNENREPAEIKLLFETGRQLDRRLGYNVPRTNEVAAVYVPGADGEVPNAKIVIRERGKELKILKSTDSMVTPMTYPLFYPRGTLGWHPEMKHRNSNRRVTRLQYVCYTVAIREREFNPILYGGKLFQQYCVDEYVKIEGDRINWIKCNQKKILADAYKNVDNMLMRRAQERGLPLGRKVILPPSMTNSPRYVEKHFQDAMAVVRRFGKPDMFLTMTCNPQWEEISENLFHEQKSSDRPDLVVRVFILKVKAIMNEIVKKKIFGEVIAWMYPVENQGRGLPHIHLLLTLAEQDKLINGEDVEKKGISARIPDKEHEYVLFDLVKRFMIHGPCGNLNPNCPCMEEFVDKNGMRGRKCSKGYPKAFQEETVVLENGLALYARPNDGRTVQVFANGGRHELDNRWVVPHNLYLLKMFKCHINLEKVNSVSSVKYLHKYVHKPPDRARLELEEKNDHDEVKEFIDARYVCPQEAVWRIFELPMYDRSHCIMSLPVHLQGEHICYFDENMEEEEIRERIANGSELMAYFELNKTNVLAKTLFYHQIPEKFCFKKGKWTERKSYFNTIGRMVKVSPAEPERYHLRLLLLNVKGACSYDELKTVIDVNGNVRVCETFSVACLERGLIRNDEEWKRALEEAESFEMPWKLREFFALILVHCNPAEPEELWNMFKDSLSEDFSRSFRKELAYAKAYKEIALSIMKAGKTLADFPTMEQINVDDDVEQVFDLAEELDLGQRDYALMYAEQREICDEILHRIWNPVNEPAFYFLSGPGGTGKTHVNKTIVHMLRGQKKKVCTMAFTGIAATLLPAGRTLHNRFGLTLDMSNSSISPRSRAWQELKETDLFICDEAPMINKRAMRTLDEKLREIMKNRIAFGGKVMLWTGDFRQTLPIQRHATRAEVVNSTLKRSEYWRLAKRYKLTKNMRALETEQEFAKDLLEIGTGKWNSENDEIILPENCISYGDLAEEIFANCIASENWNEMAKSAILAPKNVDVSEMNNRVLEMLPGEEVMYTSIDLAQDENRQRADDYLDEYLNALNPSGFPRHKLRLKKNAIVLLMRNLNIEMGLCNGSRMKVEEMHPNLIMCKILTGDKAGQTVYIPRITLCCSEDYPFDLHRHQFPLVLAFAMTINKAQGQTLEQVGIDLRKDVFSHGQSRQIDSDPSNYIQKRPVIQSRASSGFAGPNILNTHQQRSDDYHANASGKSQVRQILPIRLQRTNVAQSSTSNTNRLNTSLMTNSTRVQQQRPAAGHAENDQLRRNSDRQEPRSVAPSNTANTNTMNTGQVRRNSDRQEPRSVEESSTSNTNTMNTGQVRRNSDRQEPRSVVPSNTANTNTMNTGKMIYGQVRRNPNQVQPESISNINAPNKNAAELDRLLALQLHNNMNQQMQLRDQEFARRTQQEEDQAAELHSLGLARRTQEQEDQAAELHSLGLARRTQQQEDQAAELHSLEVARAIQEEEYQRGLMNSSQEADSSITRTNSSDLTQRQTQNASAGHVRRNSRRQQPMNVAPSNTANMNTMNTDQVRRNSDRQEPRSVEESSTSNTNTMNTGQVRRNSRRQQPRRAAESSTANTNTMNTDTITRNNSDLNQRQTQNPSAGQHRRNSRQQQPGSFEESSTSNTNSDQVRRNSDRQKLRRAAESSTSNTNTVNSDDAREGSQTNHQNDDDDADDDCTICLSRLSDGNENGPIKTAFSCNHFFHRDCINVWLNTSKNCPICRAAVNDDKDVGQSSQGGASNNTDESTLPDQLYGVASAFSQGIASFVNWFLGSNTNELPHYYEQIALLQSATIPSMLLMEEENGQTKIVMIVAINLNANQPYLTVIDSDQEIHTLYIGRNGQNHMTFRDTNGRLNISYIIANMPVDN
ncbi:hypothetical protein niasHT_008189 [Heterodera trifolii]|uniref:ATP-dependent DNA helicase n=1 Tax=Heterodera trifolii TaxID=157864 RepID=A0ABD2LVE6_9BILA